MTAPHRTVIWPPRLLSLKLPRVVEHPDDTQRLYAGRQRHRLRRLRIVEKRSEGSP